MKQIRWLANTALVTLSVLATNSAQAGLTADVTYKVEVGAVITDAIVTIDGIKASGFYLGELVLKQAGSLGTDFESPWSTVCTDIKAQLVVGSTYNFHRSEFDSTTTGLNPKWGADKGGPNAIQAIQNAADIFYDHAGATSYGTGGNNLPNTRKEWWAALQLAVWEVLYDTGNTFDFASGRFTVQNFGGADIQALANSWLLTSNQQYSGDLLIPLKNLSGSPTPIGDINASVQELLYTITPVPEASTIIAGALLLLPFGASTLRFVRRSPHP